MPDDEPEAASPAEREAAPSDTTSEPAASDRALYQRARALLEPGDIDLVGLVIHTTIPSEDEPRLHQATIDIGDVIAEHRGVDPTDTYVYSGNDDPEFGVNQHQGRTLDDEFLWECQQLLREGTYDIVIYYEADVDQPAIVEAIREREFDVAVELDVVPVTP